MFCSKCGAQLDDRSQFCNMCGTPTEPLTPEEMEAPKPKMQAPKPEPPKPAAQPKPVQPKPQPAPQPAQPKPKNKKALVAIIVSAAAFLTLLLVIGLAVFFVMRVKDAAKEAETQEISEPKEKKEKLKKKEEKPAEEEEPEEEPVPVPFAEENGFTFEDPYDQIFYAPTCVEAYYTDENGNRTEDIGEDHAEATSTDCSYSFRPFTVSEPDEEGNVVITITQDSEFSTTVVNKGVEPNCAFDTHYRMFRLFDYYTGQQIIIPDYSELTYEMDEALTEIQWMGETIPIRVCAHEEWEQGSFEEAGESVDGFPVYENHTTFTVFYRIRVPQDYDGLMLVGYKDGVNNEIVTMETHDSGEGRSVLGPDIYGITYTADDLFLIRACEDIKETVPYDFVASRNIALFYPGLQTHAKLMKVKNEKDTDEMLYMPTNCEVSETIEDCEPGTKKVVGHFTIDYSNEEKNVAFEAWVDALDRYTGTSFMSGSPLTINTKTKATELEEPITLETPYGAREIFMEVESKMDKKNKVMDRTITITCPTDYDGTVFMVGYSSRALAEKLDFEALAARKTPISEMPFYQSGEPYYFYTLNGY